MAYGDYRDFMAPQTVLAIPRDVDSRAILESETAVDGFHLRPIAFGGLVSALAEAGVISTKDYSTARSETAELLGIGDDEFDQRIASTVTINHDTALEWMDHEKRCRLQQARAATERDVHDFCEALLAGRGDDEHPPSVSLVELAEQMREMGFFQGYGEAFATGVAYEFGHDLEESGFELPDKFGDLYTKEPWIDEAEFAGIELTMEELKLLAPAYANNYFTRSEPGYTELRRTIGPVARALFVVPEETAAFFQKFPLEKNAPPRLLRDLAKLAVEN